MILVSSNLTSTKIRARNQFFTNTPFPWRRGRIRSIFEHQVSTNELRSSSSLKLQSSMSAERNFCPKCFPERMFSGQTDVIRFQRCPKLCLCEILHILYLPVQLFCSRMHHRILSAIQAGNCWDDERAERIMRSRLRPVGDYSPVEYNLGSVMPLRIRSTLFISK